MSGGPARRRNRYRAAAWLFLFAVTALLMPSPARADEPSPNPGPWAGRPADAPNIDAGARVPPLPPEYHVQEEGWIRFAYHPAARERVRPLIGRAPAIRAELTALFGESVLRSIEIRVAALPGELPRLAPVELPSYASSASFGRLHLVVMSLASPLSLEPPDLEDGLRHALAHIALDEAVDGRPVPRWLHEGFAVHLSDEETALRAQTLAMASLRGRLVGLAELDARFPADAPQSSVAYAQAADFVRFLLDEKRRDQFRDLVQRARLGETFDRALAGAYGASVPDVEAAWRKDVARRYSFLPVLMSGSLLWIVVASVALLQRLRMRRVRRPLLVRRTRPTEEARTRTTIVTTPVRVVAIRRRELSARGEGGRPDDVPKVEHGGRWYTLH